MSYLCYNGEIVSEAEISLSAGNRGMMYGDGCFDTLRACKGKFLALEQHWQRFSGAMNYLGLKSPFDMDEYKEYLRSVLQANKAAEGEFILRTQCWRKGGRGYSTTESECEWMMSVSELPTPKKHYSLATVQTRAIPEESLSRKYKLSNGLCYIQAAREASLRNADDALLQTIEGKVAETTIANIFWIREDEVYTPSVSCDIYPGVTREILLDLIRGMGIPVTEAEFSLKDILDAEEVFGVNSVREMFPVNQIDDVIFQTDHPLYRDIFQCFNSYKENTLK